jgi:hypothetical protein
MTDSPAFRQLQINIFADLTAKLPENTELQPMVLNLVQSLHPDTASQFLAAGNVAPQMLAINLGS